MEGDQLDVIAGVEVPVAPVPQQERIRELALDHARRGGPAHRDVHQLELGAARFRLNTEDYPYYPRFSELMEFSNTITIERSLPDVFEFVSDLENVPKWNYAIAETRKVSEGPVDIGTTYRQFRSLPSRSEETLEVVQLDPDRRFAVRGDLGPLRGTLSYEFEEVGGSTRLTNRAELEGRGIAKLAAPIASGRVRNAVAENLETLKRLLEREPAD